MAIRPNNLTPNTAVVRSPSDNEQRYGNLINSPRMPEFGGADAVRRVSKRAPYGTIKHVGRKGRA